jgi:hypothetical protein
VCFKWCPAPRCIGLQCAGYRAPTRHRQQRRPWSLSPSATSCGLSEFRAAVALWRPRRWTLGSAAVPLCKRCLPVWASCALQLGPRCRLHPCRYGGCVDFCEFMCVQTAMCCLPCAAVGYHLLSVFVGRLLSRCCLAAVSLLSRCCLAAVSLLSRCCLAAACGWCLFGCCLIARYVLPFPFPPVTGSVCGVAKVATCDGGSRLSSALFSPLGGARVHRG